MRKIEPDWTGQRTFKVQSIQATALAVVIDSIVALCRSIQCWPLSYDPIE